MTALLAKYYSGDKIRKCDMGEACVAQMGESYRIYRGNVKKSLLS